uniref:Uncharacterized protein n=1 Tax=Spongospora subterranea TaxID=70186 RepID=A0A0H5RA39_9EUKA|eukprot:CRZ10666.1 hypothetical protein [Spongospora subterranea]
MEIPELRVNNDCAMRAFLNGGIPCRAIVELSLTSPDTISRLLTIDHPLLYYVVTNIIHADAAEHLSATASEAFFRRSSTDEISAPILDYSCFGDSELCTYEFIQTLCIDKGVQRLIDQRVSQFWFDILSSCEQAFIISAMPMQCLQFPAVNADHKHIRQCLLDYIMSETRVSDKSLSILFHLPSAMQSTFMNSSHPRLFLAALCFSCRERSSNIPHFPESITAQFIQAISCLEDEDVLSPIVMATLSHLLDRSYDPLYQFLCLDVHGTAAPISSSIEIASLIVFGKSVPNACIYSLHCLVEFICNPHVPISSIVINSAYALLLKPHCRLAAISILSDARSTTSLFDAITPSNLIDRLFSAIAEPSENYAENNCSSCSISLCKLNLEILNSIRPDSQLAVDLQIRLARSNPDLTVNLIRRFSQEIISGSSSTLTNACSLGLSVILGCAACMNNKFCTNSPQRTACHLGVHVSKAINDDFWQLSSRILTIASEFPLVFSCYMKSISVICNLKNPQTSAIFSVRCTEKLLSYLDIVINQILVASITPAQETIHAQLAQHIYEIKERSMPCSVYAIDHSRLIPELIDVIATSSSLKLAANSAMLLGVLIHDLATHRTMNVDFERRAIRRISRSNLLRACCKKIIAACFMDFAGNIEVIKAIMESICIISRLDAIEVSSTLFGKSAQGVPLLVQIMDAFIRTGQHQRHDLIADLLQPLRDLFEAGCARTELKFSATFIRSRDFPSRLMLLLRHLTVPLDDADSAFLSVLTKIPAIVCEMKKMPRVMEWLGTTNSAL